MAVSKPFAGKNRPPACNPTEQGVEKNPYRIRGSIALLDELTRRGTTCYLASGTDEPFVIAEAKLLGVDHYFSERIYGARDDYQAFSKQMLLEQIRNDHGLHVAELAVFGDGYVEIESAEQGWDEWKKERLRTAGAQIMVPDWQESALLLSFLFGETDV